MCFALFTKDLGIDLGTANTLIYSKGKGIILNEPSVIAVDEYNRKILATGLEAKEMIGRAPAHIRVVRPIQDGVISDFEMTQTMLKDFLRKVVPERSFITKTRVVVGVPSGVTEVEKRAVEEVTRQMGIQDVYILDEPFAAALGVGLPVDEANGCMIADIGGGTSDIAIIALGGIVNSTSIRFAGDKMDEAIVGYMRRTHNLLIGDKMAESIKMEIGCALPEGGEEPGSLLSMDAKGRDVLTGLPKTVRITSLDVMQALEEPIALIIDGIKSTLENAPPELSADIVNNGMVLSGGGALLRGLDRHIENETGMQVHIAENALEAVAEGAGKSLQDLEKVKRYSRRPKRY
ncbi:MAG: rod shape-determining protein [Bacillota bacterium]|nr:rod shape-determining protein [Bacillota bacterium]